MTTLQQDIDTISGGRSRLAAAVAGTSALAYDRARAFAELVSVASKADIGFVRSVALILKYEAERQQALGTSEDFLGNSLLSEWPITEMANALRPAFKDDPQFNDGGLTMTVTEMILLSLHGVATDSEALDYFARQRQITVRQSSEADSATKRLFAVRKGAWLRATEEFGNLILRRENCMLQIEMLRQSFMQMFAIEFIAEKEQSSRREVARLRLRLIQENPELSADEISERLQDQIVEQQEKLHAYHLSAAYSLVVPHNASEMNSKEDLQTAKHLLRRLAMLTHPDRLRNVNLTTEQRRELSRIWTCTHALRGSRSDQSMLCRSISTLKQNLEQAQQILKLAGIEGLDAALTIQGETLQERVSWLENACNEVDQQIVTIQAEIFAVSSDQELKFMRALIDAPESTQEQQRKAMKKNAEKCRIEADRIDKESDELLSVTPGPGGLH